MRISITFGRCKRCNGNGADYPASALTSADAQDNLDTTGNGIKLEKFRGEWLCPVCIKRILQDEESLIHARKYAETERFLGRVGFTKSV